MRFGRMMLMVVLVYSVVVLQHAVSVSMPLWSHVVGYEEGDLTVHSKLACGYPRFVYHPYIRELAEVREDLFSLV